MAVCVAIDFETSGYSPLCACAVGLARLRLPGLPAPTDPAPAGDAVFPADAAAGVLSASLPDEDCLYTLICPPKSKIMFTHIHGLTWDMLKHALTFAEVWPRLRLFLDGADYLIAHNARFDRDVLWACCKAAGLPRPAAPFLCTLKGSRKGVASKPHSLDAMCRRFSIPLNHHHAGSDARACALLFLHLLRLGVPLEAMSL